MAPTMKLRTDITMEGSNDGSTKSVSDLTKFTEGAESEPVDTVEHLSGTDLEPVKNENTQRFNLKTAKQIESKVEVSTTEKTNDKITFGEENMGIDDKVPAGPEQAVQPLPAIEENEATSVEPSGGKPADSVEVPMADQKRGSGITTMNATQSSEPETEQMMLPATHGKAAVLLFQTHERASEEPDKDGTVDNADTVMGNAEESSRGVVVVADTVEGRAEMGDATSKDVEVLESTTTSNRYPTAEAEKEAATGEVDVQMQDEDESSNDVTAAAENTRTPSEADSDSIQQAKTPSSAVKGSGNTSAEDHAANGKPMADADAATSVEPDGTTAGATPSGNGKRKASNFTDDKSPAKKVKILEVVVDEDEVDDVMEDAQGDVQPNGDIAPAMASSEQSTDSAATEASLATPEDTAMDPGAENSDAQDDPDPIEGSDKKIEKQGRKDKEAVRATAEAAGAKKGGTRDGSIMSYFYTSKESTASTKKASGLQKVEEAQQPKLKAAIQGVMTQKPATKASPIYIGSDSEEEAPTPATKKSARAKTHQESKAASQKGTGTATTSKEGRAETVESGDESELGTEEATKKGNSKSKPKQTATKSSKTTFASKKKPHQTEDSDQDTDHEQGSKAAQRPKNQQISKSAAEKPGQTAAAKRKQSKEAEGYDQESGSGEEAKAPIKKTKGKQQLKPTATKPGKSTAVAKKQTPQAGEAEEPGSEGEEDDDGESEDEPAPKIQKGRVATKAGVKKRCKWTEAEVKREQTAVRKEAVEKQKGQGAFDLQELRKKFARESKAFTEKTESEAAKVETKHQKEIIKLEKKLETAEKTLGGLRDKYTKAVDKLKTTSQAIVDAAKTRKQEVETKNRKLTTERDDAVKKFRDLQKATTQQINDAKHNMEANRKLLAEQKKQFERERKEAMNEARPELNSAVKQQKAENKTLEAEIAELKQTQTGLRRKIQSDGLTAAANQARYDQGKQEVAKMQQRIKDKDSSLHDYERYFSQHEQRAGMDLAREKDAVYQLRTKVDQLTRNNDEHSKRIVAEKHANFMLKQEAERGLKSIRDLERKVAKLEQEIHLRDQVALRGMDAEVAPSIE